MGAGIGTYAVIVTAILHGGLAVVIATIDGDDPQVPTVITLVETPKKPPPKPPAPPPPPPAAAKPPEVKAPVQPRPPPPPRHAAAPPPAAAAPAAPAAPPEFGVKLGGPSGNGPALPVATAPAPPAAAAPPAHKELRAPSDGGCPDPVVKPKPIHVVQPAFTQAAQDAHISGKVRVEILISATGEVTGARVLEGLGYGLDEAALEAARASTFEPATRCGQAVATTFTIGMRFTP